MKWVNGLKHFRESRGLTTLQPNYLDMMSEELDEYEAAVKAADWDEQVDAVCDQLVLTENCIQQTHPLVTDYQRTGFSDEPTKAQLLAQYVGTEPDDDLDVLYAIADLLELELLDLGVVVDLAMKQCVKHISCRVQDPIQAARWQADPSLIGTEKWQKDRSQDPATIFQPDYRLCLSKPRR